MITYILKQIAQNYFDLFDTLKQRKHYFCICRTPFCCLSTVFRYGRRPFPTDFAGSSCFQLISQGALECKLEADLLSQPTLYTCIMRFLFSSAGWFAGDVLWFASNCRWSNLNRLMVESPNQPLLGRVAFGWLEYPWIILKLKELSRSKQSMCDRWHNSIISIDLSPKKTQKYC